MAADQSPRTDVSELMKRSRDAAYTHSPYNSSQAPWTATRCLRLLRPISSKINTLDKLRRKGENGEDDDLFYDSENDHKIASQALQAHREHLDESWDIDPRPRKKIKRTYSTRRKNAAERTSDRHHEEQQRIMGRDTWRTYLGVNEKQDGNDVKMGRERTSNDKHDPLERFFHTPYSQEAYSLYQRTTAKHIAEITGIAQVKRTTSNTTNERLKLCKGITGSISALLKATNGTTVKKRNGASSFYAMCLKRMPNFIADEEHYIRTEQPDSDQDVISDIYTYLESQAISDSWKPLRTIVRAHGIQHICVAIDQGILSIGMAVEMVQICLQERACDEAVTIMHRILHAFLHKMETKPEPASSRDQSQILGAFLKIVSQVGEESYTIRLLSKAIRSPLALTACAPLLINPSVSAMNAVGRRTGSDRLPEASMLLRTLNKASICGDMNDISTKIATLRTASALNSKRPSRRQRALHDPCKRNSHDQESDRSQTMRHGIGNDAHHPVGISGSMIEMTGVVLLHQDRSKRGESTSCADLEYLFEALDQDTRQVLETSDDVQFSVRQRQVIAITLWARGMSRLSATQSFDREACSRFGEVSGLAEMDLQNPEISLLGLFTYRVVDFCEQLNSADAFDMLKDLLEAIIQLIRVSSSEPRRRSLLQKLAVSSAFAFCEASEQPCHLEWALGVEEKIFGKDCLSPDRSTLRTPAKVVGTSRIGYRWEEGICEWITGTPASAVDQAERYSLEVGDTIDELDDTTLVEAWPIRLPVESDFQKSPSDMKKIFTQSASTMPKNCDSADELKVVSISVAEIDPDTSTTDSSFNTAAEKVEGVLACQIQGDDEIDELCGEWSSQPSTQSSFQNLQSKQQTDHGRSSRTGSRAKSQGHRLLSRAVGRSLAALFDNGDQSSDMEDELGI